MLKETADGVILSIRVIPRSSKCGPAGIQDGALKLKISAPPVEGRANEECTSLLADLLGVSKSRVTIIAGHKSRAKKVAVAGVGRKEVESILAAL